MTPVSPNDSQAVRRAWRALSALAMLLAAASIFMSVLLFRFNAQRAKDIQQSRSELILTSCRDQNERHEFALSVTVRLLARPPVPPAKSLTPMEKAARDAAVRTWVNALVPERDCSKLVSRSIP